LWDEDRQVLRHFPNAADAAGPALPTADSSRAGSIVLRDGSWDAPLSSRTVSAQAYTSQQAIISLDITRDDPENAELYRAYHARSALAAPITAGPQRLGALVVYAPRAPIFANSDIELVQLMADQAAVILESRALIDEAARVRAREQAARLKDDFLSAAAHDLKTPLTTLIGQAQLLSRKAAAAALDAATLRDGLDRIAREGRRLSELVLELLDASRVERGQLLSRREAVDLVDVARQVSARVSSDYHRVAVEAEGRLVGAYDRVRIEQLIGNLVENAVKYSPGGGEVRVRLWNEEGRARVTVSDQGIGIPAADLPLLFERYHRGSNVDDRRFSGMGLGLYISRGIVEEHGGRIWAESNAGHGTTFHVDLPIELALVEAA
jgi:signal transduction histidine kinase